MKGVRDALLRLSGVKSVAVKLQENRVIVETDPHRSVRPSLVWNEILRVGFGVEQMQIWAWGRVQVEAVLVGAACWPLITPMAVDPEHRRLRLKVEHGGEDPPRVASVEYPNN